MSLSVANACPRCGVASACRRRRRRAQRRAGLLGGVAAVLVGCGGQTKIAMVARPAAHLIVAPSAVTTTATAVPESVAARAEKSVLPMFCFSPQAVGTGFVVASGVVTASHVVAACPAGATFQFAP